MPAATIDTAAARAYEDHLVGPLFAPWARRMVAMAAPVAGETVLDVACGTGIGARLVAPFLSPGGRVISADSDAAMVAVAEAVAQAAGLPDDVALAWHAKAAETKLVADGSIDLCLCLQGPQFLADPPAAMALMAAALRPGGRLAASMWNEYSTNKGHHAIGQALLARGMKPALKPFSMGDPVRARRLVEDAGLVIERFETGDETVASPRPGHLSKAWRPARRRRGMRWRSFRRASSTGSSTMSTGCWPPTGWRTGWHCRLRHIWFWRANRCRVVLSDAGRRRVSRRKSEGAWIRHDADRQIRRIDQ